MPRLTGSLVMLLTAAALSAAACQGHPIPRARAQDLLDAQAGCWNRGDLPGFVDSYWDGPELTFLGRDGLLRGRAELLARYRSSYPTAQARGQLSFEILEYRPLGDDHALLLGRYHLERAQPAAGLFSLVLVRRDGEPVILHDHSTAGN